MKIAPRFPIRNTRVVLRIPEILRICAGKKILHIGCTDMPYTLLRGENLLHKQLAGVTKPESLWGIDINEEGVQLLRSMGFEHVIHGNAENLSSELRQEHFDIVLAGEIIEHVLNPGLFLESIISIMTEKTELLLTTVNASSFKQFLHSMIREEKVHQDHHFYFSYRTLKQLMQSVKLRCREIYFYQDVVGHGFGGFIDKAIFVMTKISPVWSDGLIARAKL